MIYVDSLPYSSAVPYELDYVLDVAALRIGIPWTFHLFFFRLRTRSMLPKKKKIRRSVGSNTKEEPYAAQMFRNIRTAILSITIRRNTYAAHTFSKCWYAPPFSLYCRTPIP